MTIIINLINIIIIITIILYFIKMIWGFESLLSSTRKRMNANRQECGIYWMHIIMIILNCVLIGVARDKPSLKGLRCPIMLPPFSFGEFFLHLYPFLTNIWIFPNFLFRFQLRTQSRFHHSHNRRAIIPLSTRYVSCCAMCILVLNTRLAENLKRA